MVDDDGEERDPAKIWEVPDDLWDQIHPVILEFDVPSYRTDAAQQRGQKQEDQAAPPGPG